MTANQQHPWGRCTECKYGERDKLCSHHHSTRLVPYSGHLRRCGGYEQARAKIRLADEYDAAQERGEVAKNGGDRSSVPDGNSAIPTAADIGLSRKDIHEARTLRDAAQERGEVATDGRPKTVSDGNGIKPTASDLGLSRKEPVSEPAPMPVRVRCFECGHFVRRGSLCGAYRTPTAATLDATDCPARNGIVPRPELKRERERRCRN